MKRFTDAFFMTLSMFCAVPCPYRPWRDDARGLMPFFLWLVGLVIGALWAAAVFVCKFFDLPAALTAAVIAASPYLLTGFFHLDGFMDTSDALLSRRDREERLRILKDSHVGAFSVISVVLLMMFAFAAGLTFEENNADVRLLIIIPAAVRLCAAFAVTHLKPLGHSQYSRQSEAAPAWMTTVILGEMLLVFALAWLLGGVNAVIAAGAAVLCYSLALTRAVCDLGGVSGDLSGYALTLGELGALIVCALLY